MYISLLVGCRWKAPNGPVSSSDYTRPAGLLIIKQVAFFCGKTFLVYYIRIEISILLRPALNARHIFYLDSGKRTSFPYKLVGLGWNRKRKPLYNSPFSKITYSNWGIFPNIYPQLLIANVWMNVRILNTFAIFLILFSNNKSPIQSH